MTIYHVQGKGYLYVWENRQTFCFFPFPPNSRVTAVQSFGEMRWNENLVPMCLCEITYDQKQARSIFIMDPESVPGNIVLDPAGQDAAWSGDRIMLAYNARPHHDGGGYDLPKIDYCDLTGYRSEAHYFQHPTAQQNTKVVIMGDFIALYDPAPAGSVVIQLYRIDNRALVVNFKVNRSLTSTRNCVFRDGELIITDSNPQTGATDTTTIPQMFSA